MSARQDFLQEVAETLNKMAADGFIDVTAERLAREFCGRRNIGHGMSDEIAEAHNEIIDLAHKMALHLDWMPVSKAYFTEKLYAIEEIEDNDIIRAVCVGYGKPCFGFRLARGERDLFYERWTNHYHGVRSGVEKAADKKTLRAAANNHLPQPVAAGMIAKARSKGLNGTDYPVYFHYYKDKDDPNQARVKSSWTSPATTLWYGDKKAIALFTRGMDRQRINEPLFKDEMRYLTGKKYRGIDPKQTVRIVQSVYSQLIYAIFQKSPEKITLTKTELDTAAKEIDIAAVIHRAMAAYQKPPTNLLKDENE